MKYDIEIAKVSYQPSVQPQGFAFFIRLFAFRRLFVIAMLTFYLPSMGQQLVVDTTFQPYFDFYPLSRKGNIHFIYEDEENGKLWILGFFSYSDGSRIHTNFTAMLKDGSRNTKFPATNAASNILRIQRTNDSTMMMISSGGHVPLDTNGRREVSTYVDNLLETVRCGQGSAQPYFYQDGSCLAINRTRPGLCDIVSYGDTFPNQSIVKVTPSGEFDSTFRHSTDDSPSGFVPYDSNRIWIYGLSRKFRYYDSVQVNGLCRIYVDGTLDTSFHNPFQDRLGKWVDNSLDIQAMLPDGDVLVSGFFYLEGDSTPYNLVQLKPNGQVDTSFIKAKAKADPLNGIIESGIGSAILTEDHGFLVGGFFDDYNGHAANSLAKIDSNGRFDSTAIAFRGPDSSIWPAGPQAIINQIIKSSFGGYYVIGEFKLWDSLPLNPIKRLIWDSSLVGTGIAQNYAPKKIQIQVFPNPAAELIQIKSNKEIVQIRLFDISGKEQLNIESVSSKKQFRLSVAKLPEGIYLLQIQTKDGASSTRKFVKGS